MAGGYQCFHCGSNSVGWVGDFSFEDFCMEGEGIVQVCKCGNCGADIHYLISTSDTEEETDDGSKA